MNVNFLNWVLNFLKLRLKSVVSHQYLANTSTSSK